MNISNRLVDLATKVALRAQWVNEDNCSIYCGLIPPYLNQCIFSMQAITSVDYISGSQLTTLIWCYLYIHILCRYISLVTI